MRRAFEFLEQQVAGGKIGVYGTATWSGFRLGPEEPQYLQMEELVKIAFEIAGRDHHFRAVQLPFNLAMPEALTLANQQLPDRRGTALRAAVGFGIAVCASASLLQGRLASGLPPIMAQAFEGLTTDAQRALQFVRSAPGINVALVGTKSAGARERGSAGVAASPGIDRSLLQALHPQQERVNIRFACDPTCSSHAAASLRPAVDGWASLLASSKADGCYRRDREQSDCWRGIVAAGVAHRR